MQFDVLETMPLFRCMGSCKTGLNMARSNRESIWADAEVELATQVSWIAVDWGTTNLRVWGVNGKGEKVYSASSENGMGKLASHEFEPALLELIEPWLSDNRAIPVIACGMVGSSQGWVEASYRSVPCEPLSVQETASPETTDSRILVRIIPGLKQTKPNFDVMRGEETQIAGFLSLSSDFDGVVCLPGTHTKWVRVSAGEIVSFQSFMTGEIHQLLSLQSVLRHSLQAKGWSKTEFAFAVDAIISKPESVASRLFSIRATSLIAGLSPEGAAGRLTGTLIGAELAASRPYWLGQNVVIIGSSDASATYAEGLRLVGHAPRVQDAAPVTLIGLNSAIAQIRNS